MKKSFHFAVVAAGILGASSAMAVSVAPPAYTLDDVELRLSVSCKATDGTPLIQLGHELVLTRNGMEANYPVSVYLNGDGNSSDGLAFQLFRGPEYVTGYTLVNGPVKKVIDIQGNLPASGTIDGVEITAGSPGIPISPEGMTIDDLKVGGKNVSCLIKKTEQNPHFVTLSN